MMKNLKFILFSLLISVFSISVLSAKDSEYQRVTIGKQDAPVTLYMFYAITCVHCANLHKNVFPDIKKNYIDKDLVKMVFMEVPMPSAEILFAYSLLNQSISTDQYLKLTSALFQEQNNWARSSNPKKLFITYAKLIGMSEDSIKKAENDKNYPEWLLKDTKKQLQDLQIQGTPTMLIVKTGDPIKAYKAKIEGERSFKEFSKQIDKLL